MPRRKSIASRLFLWLFLTGLAALAAGGAVLYLEVRSLVLSSLDHTLESDLEIFSGLLHEEDGELEFEYEEVTSGNFNLPRSGHYYEIVVEGELFASSPSLAGERLDLSSAHLEKEGETGERILTARGAAGEPIRVVERAGIFAGRATTIVVAHSLEESLEVLRRFRNFLLALGPAGILLVALVGLLISRRSLRPLELFSETVRRTTERTLDQRMETDNEYREFAALAASFNAMLDRLQSSFQAQEELLSDVSHELKTPLSVIRSHCDVYLQKARGAEEYVEALEAIRESADQMALKIRRLLGAAQTEADLAGTETLRAVSLNDCLRKARLLVEPLARDRKVSLSEEIAPDLIVLGREERLTEAFANLMENAVKYNVEEGKVEIAADRREGQVRVRIEDTGCGIAPEEIPRIFERFYRGDKSREKEGAGLGLGIVKAIIELHGGTIEVESRPGRGSSFTITLPSPPPVV